jgi:hypothetical protein
MRRTEIVGWISLIFTGVGATWLAFLGDSVLVWIIYGIASTTGIRYHAWLHQQMKKENKSNLSQIIMFVFFLVMNIVSLTRNLLFG